MHPRTYRTLAFILIIVTLLTSACSLAQPDLPDADPDLAATLAGQSTQLAVLATDAAEQEQVNRSQWDAIAYLSTQMPFALGIITPIPPGTTLIPTPYQTTESPTPFVMCTPPACAPHEMYYCPAECPGGCGTTCATATPGISFGFGEVWGEICYPGDSSPAMNLYFHNLETWRVHPFRIEEAQTSYRYELPAGVYIAFAFTSDSTYSVGTYSEVVVCGFGDRCTDHSHAPFLVREGHVTLAVDICDWYTATQQSPIP